MEVKNIILAGIPLTVGVVLLILRLNEIRFYSFESPIAWSFLAFGVALGVFVMAYGESGKKTLLGVPVE
jgi:hypothetical protein